jgi:hypothetical protein
VITRLEFYLFACFLTVIIIGVNFYTTAYVPTPVLPIAENTLIKLDTALADFTDQIAENQRMGVMNTDDIEYVKNILVLIQNELKEVNRKLNKL